MILQTWVKSTFLPPAKAPPIKLESFENLSRAANQGSVAPHGSGRGLLWEMKRKQSISWIPPFPSQAIVSLAAIDVRVCVHHAVCLFHLQRRVGFRGVRGATAMGAYGIELNLDDHARQTTVRGCRPMGGLN